MLAVTSLHLRASLFSLLMSAVQVEEENKGLEWWAILLILAIVVAIVIWALTRSASRTEPPSGGHAAAHEETPSVEHEVASAVRLAEEPPAAAPAIKAMPAEPAVAAEPAVERVEDLELIEGIGPVIARVLRAAGINTFAQLAAADVDSLRDILQQANLRLGDPASWPEQARLAAAGEWDALKAFQDQLKGGRTA